MREHIPLISVQLIMSKCDEICTQKCSEKKLNKYEIENTTSTLMYNSSLDVFAEYKKFRGTSIVCTIGPACNDVETIKEMIKTGMCIARFNFSHGDLAYHKSLMDNVRTAAESMPDYPQIALALDTKGPEIRTGINKDNAQIVLKKDDVVTITTDEAFKTSSTAEKLYMDYKSLASSVKIGQIILVADGSVVMEVTEIKGTDVICKVISGYSFGSKKNVCLPGVKVDLPTLSLKDIEDIKFGMEQRVDIIFASFIRTGENVKEIRNLLNTTEHGKGIKIISKIENFEGLQNINEIINLSDGIMAARGDLGMDISIERVIVAQKMMAAKCNMSNKPFICATQMLESMINNFRPTRAEVSDVVNAVLDGADAVMLSGETANGKYPIEAVRIMHVGCTAAEEMLSTKKAFEEIKNVYCSMNESEATAMSAVGASYKCKASGIFVLSTTGKTAHLLSNFRPRCPIFMITRNDIVARQAQLYRNIFPIYYPEGRMNVWGDDMDARFEFAIQFAIKKGYCSIGSRAIFICGLKCGEGSTNTMRIETIGDKYKPKK